jgi:hypothetical protein
MKITSQVVQGDVVWRVCVCVFACFSASWYTCRLLLSIACCTASVSGQYCASWFFAEWTPLAVYASETPYTGLTFTEEDGERRRREEKRREEKRRKEEKKEKRDHSKGCTASWTQSNHREAYACKVPSLLPSPRSRCPIHSSCLQWLVQPRGWRHTRSVTVRGLWLHRTSTRPLRSCSVCRCRAFKVLEASWKLFVSEFCVCVCVCVQKRIEDVADGRPPQTARVGGTDSLTEDRADADHIPHAVGMEWMRKR